MPRQPPSRRQVLRLGGLTAVAVVLGPRLAGCSRRGVVEVEDGPHAAGWREVAVEAARRVEGLWGQDALPTPVRVRLPADAASFAAAAGATREEVDDIPAVTVGSGAAAVVVVHPAAWDRLLPEGRTAVLTHEITHLAMQGDGPVPGWLGEGLAEFTAHRGSTRPAAEIAGSALDAIGPGSLPQSWPDPLTPTADRWVSYAQSWLACLFLAERWGEPALLALYDAVSGGQDLATALPAVLGEQEAVVLAAWGVWLTSLT